MALLSENNPLLVDVPAKRPMQPSPGRRILRLLRGARMVRPIAAAVTALVLALGLALLLMLAPSGEPPPVLILVASLLAALIAMIVAWVRLGSELLKPLVNLEQAVAQVCQGEPGANLTLRHVGVLGEMVRDIDSLNEEISDLYVDMDNRVARQTSRLAQKTASLKILYDVAASINQAQGLDDLLLRFLRVLKEMVAARAATVRLVMPDGKRRLVGSIGLDDDLLREHEMLPVDLCLCGTALSPGDILCSNDAKYCSRLYGRRMFRSDEVELISVPLNYQEEVLGVYDLFVVKPGVSDREDIMELLSTIGHHLGMAVAKQRSDEEARRLSIIEERTNLAHELHDSIAQTLASLRFQVRLLDDTLRRSQAPDAAIGELERIRVGLDEAHTELRELLSNFRAPLDQRGLSPALQKLIRRFEQKTGVHAFFHQECRYLKLSAAQEMQILRIVQEALTNIRKHARAHTVRVMLNCRGAGNYVLLVEDDGEGFDSLDPAGQAGEQIGLAIMRERARRIGAELRIESEAGEGTRVELTFSPRQRSGPGTPEILRR